MPALIIEVAALLTRERIPHALIGAAAMAVAGVARSTADLDLLVIGEQLLDKSFWPHHLLPDAQTRVRRGGAQAPLAGLAQVTRPGERRVDLVVGRSAWQTAVLERATRVSFAGDLLPVVQPADLVLLKLFAGGLQDAWDIQQLLQLPVAPAIEREVLAQLPELPSRCRDLWLEIQRGNLPGRL